VALTPKVMGIVNVTPDSFYASSRTSATLDAIARGRTLFECGADLVDVGGESTRPGAEVVSVDEELRRVVDVVAALSPLGPVSIDTQKEAVARQAVAAGATMINDVSSTLAEVAGELRTAYVGMHRQGSSATMQDDPRYDDVVAEVGEFLDRVAVRARTAGVTELYLDPGIGFGKTVHHNLALLAGTATLVERAARHGAGLLVGTSRKRFLGTLSTAPLDVDDRLEGSIATEAFALCHGAAMVRVHDIEAAVQLRELIIRPLEEVSS
jgi:dihydropteroate synthase